MRSDEAPLLVIWEATRACDLACAHCHTSAAPRRHSSELTTEEARQLLTAVKDLGNPSMVIAGGNPLKRPDTLPLLRHSVALGLRTHIGPNATSLLTQEAVQELQNSGAARMATRLDWTDATPHEDSRGIPGRDVEALEGARHNSDRPGRIAGLAAKADVRAWNAFFPAVNGRAHGANEWTAAECGQVLAAPRRTGSHEQFQPRHEPK